MMSSGSVSGVEQPQSRIQVHQVATQTVYLALVTSIMPAICERLLRSALTATGCASGSGSFCIPPFWPMARHLASSHPSDFTWHYRKYEARW
jgi:hypothetical protein